MARRTEPESETMDSRTRRNRQPTTKQAEMGTAWSCIDISTYANLMIDKRDQDEQARKAMPKPPPRKTQTAARKVSEATAGKVSDLP
jgi:hypothetical protein